MCVNGNKMSLAPVDLSGRIVVANNFFIADGSGSFTAVSGSGGSGNATQSIDQLTNKLLIGSVTQASISSVSSTLSVADLVVSGDSAMEDVTMNSASISNTISGLALDVDHLMATGEDTIYGGTLSEGASVPASVPSNHIQIVPDTNSIWLGPAGGTWARIQAGGLPSTGTINSFTSSITTLKLVTITSTATFQDNVTVDATLTAGLVNSGLNVAGTQSVVVNGSGGVQIGGSGGLTVSGTGGVSLDGVAGVIVGRTATFMDDVYVAGTLTATQSHHNHLIAMAKSTASVYGGTISTTTTVSSIVPAGHIQMVPDTDGIWLGASGGTWSKLSAGGGGGADLSGPAPRSILYGSDTTMSVGANESVAFGNSISTSQAHSVAIGQSITMASARSVAIGHQLQNIGNTSTVMGQNLVVNSARSIVFGIAEGATSSIRATTSAIVSINSTVEPSTNTIAFLQNSTMSEATNCFIVGQKNASYSRVSNIISLMQHGTLTDITRGVYMGSNIQAIGQPQIAMIGHDVKSFGASCTLLGSEILLGNVLKGFAAGWSLSHNSGGLVSSLVMIGGSQSVVDSSNAMVVGFDASISTLSKLMALGAGFDVKFGASTTILGRLASLTSVSDTRLLVHNTTLSTVSDSFVGAHETDGKVIVASHLTGIFSSFTNMYTSSVDALYSSLSNNRMILGKVMQSSLSYVNTTTIDAVRSFGTSISDSSIRAVNSSFSSISNSAVQLADSSARMLVRSAVSVVGSTLTGMSSGTVMGRNITYDGFSQAGAGQANTNTVLVGNTIIGSGKSHDIAFGTDLQTPGAGSIVMGYGIRAQQSPNTYGISVLGLYGSFTAVNVSNHYGIYHSISSATNCTSVGNYMTMTTASNVVILGNNGKTHIAKDVQLFADRALLSNTSASSVTNISAIVSQATISDSHRDLIMAHNASISSLSESLVIGRSVTVDGGTSLTAVGHQMELGDQTRSTLLGSSITATGASGAVGVGNTIGIVTANRTSAIGEAVGIVDVNDGIAIGSVVTLGQARSMTVMGSTIDILQASNSVVIGSNHSVASVTRMNMVGSAITASVSQFSTLLGDSIVSTNSTNVVAVGNEIDLRTASSVVLGAYTARAYNVNNLAALGIRSTLTSVSEANLVVADASLTSLTRADVWGHNVNAISLVDTRVAGFSLTVDGDQGGVVSGVSITSLGNKDVTAMGTTVNSSGNTQSMLLGAGLNVGGGSNLTVLGAAIAATKSGTLTGSNAILVGSDIGAQGGFADLVSVGQEVYASDAAQSVLIGSGLQFTQSSNLMVVGKTVEGNDNNTSILVGHSSAVSSVTGSSVFGNNLNLNIVDTSLVGGIQTLSASTVTAESSMKDTVALGIGSKIGIGSTSVLMPIFGNVTASESVMIGVGGQSGVDSFKDNTAFRSVALGRDTDLLLHDSIVMGSGASVTSSGSVAIGFGVRHDGTSSVVIGNSATLSGTKTIAIGHLANVVGHDSVAMGAAAILSATASVMIGPNNNVHGSSVTAMGTNITASQTTMTTLIGQLMGVNNVMSSTIIGSALTITTAAQTARLVAIGHDSNAAGDRNILFGSQNTVSGTATAAIGYNAKVDNGYFANAFGSNVLVMTQSNNSIAMGTGVSLAGANSVGIGASIRAFGSSVVAIGDGARASNSENTIAIGSGALATATTNSIAIGRVVYAMGTSSIGHGSLMNILSHGGIGVGSVITNTTSLDAIGVGHRLHLGDASYSVAIGNNMSVTGTQSVVIGYQNSVSSHNAIAIGTYNTISESLKSVGIGNDVLLDQASYSTAIGYQAKAGLEGMLTFGSGAEGTFTMQTMVFRSNPDTLEAMPTTLSVSLDATSSHFRHYTPIIFHELPLYADDAAAAGNVPPGGLYLDSVNGYLRVYRGTVTATGGFVDGTITISYPTRL